MFPVHPSTLSRQKASLNASVNEICFSVTYGARNLRRTIQKELEDPIAQKIIESFVSPLHTLHAAADETGTFTVTGE